MIESPHNLINTHQPVFRRRSICCGEFTADTESTISTSFPYSQASKVRNDVKSDKKMQVFLDSLDVLAALVKMDSEKWQQTLNDSQQGSASHMERNSAAALQERFERLQSRWKFEETPIPQLFDSVHQFHSKYVHLTAHSDLVSEENESLQEELKTAQNHILKLETTVKKLHRKKETLKKERGSLKAEREILLKGVHTYARDFYKAQTSLKDSQLENHELIMKQVVDSPESKSRSSSMDETDSSTSNSLENRDDLGGRSVSPLQYHDSISCITNSGVATVRIDEGKSLSTVAGDTKYLTLRYPANSKVGLQFHQMKHNSTSKKDNRFLIKNKKRKESKSEQEELLCVCGHYGFDHLLNAIPPQIGAQLAAVNGKELGHTVSLSEIREALTQGTPYTLSFKEEVLSDEQIETLTQAAKQTKKTYDRKSNE
eukprot:CAMPEP_0194216054 /NCGR_PEP_ID=MMETSP0156-20130528/18235_1 /TAXON_ID=33649 /ORGANISM="Thalassionema nitzschioides, Strain L26-B" /LENGTH=428 /DNA_ID=CAMNT_0038944727 /DNA_START=39 /DNA_END=1325 /DNA_ORIENTATION=-